MVNFSDSKRSTRKGGRPKLITEERRRNSIRPGFTDAEFFKLENRADNAGLDLAEFVRRLALNKQFISVPEINRQALVQLSRIGSNLHQITKIANSTKSIQPTFTASINLLKLELEKITLAITLNPNPEID